MGAIDKALTEVAAGRPLLVADDRSQENPGYLVVAAELATTATMAFIVRHTSGFVCVALPADECDRLALPPQHHTNQGRHGTAYRVTVDALGTGTGISAASRARTVRALADPRTRTSDLQRPGHVVPLAARAGGVLERRGHGEAAVDLTRLAGLRPAGVLSQIVSPKDPIRMAEGRELTEFARRHELAFVTTAELANHRMQTELSVQRITETRLPTDRAQLRAVGYRASDETEHIALLAGAGPISNGPVHVHRECVLGDAFSSARCGCRAQLEAALEEVGRHGSGVVVYVRPPLTAPPGIVNSTCRADLDPYELVIAHHILEDLSREPDRTHPTLPAAVVA